MNDIRWFRLSVVAIGLFFVVIGGTNAFYYLAAFVYYTVAPSTDMYGYPASSYIWSALPGALQGCLGLVLILKSPAISRYFASRTIGRCPACNYDVSGLSESTACPECGEPVEPQRSASTPATERPSSSN